MVEQTSEEYIEKYLRWLAKEGDTPLLPWHPQEKFFCAFFLWPSWMYGTVADIQTGTTNRQNISLTCLVVP